MEDAVKKETLRRLNIIAGHIKRVIKMVEEDRYCVDVLHQSSAVKNALKEAESLILGKHLRRCVSDAMKTKNGRKEKSIRELLKIYQLSHK